MQVVRPRSSLLLFLAAFLSLFGSLLAGCSDSARAPEKIVYVPDDPNRPITVGDDAGPDTLDAGPPGIKPEVTPTGRILVVSGDDEITLNIGSSETLTVLLLDSRGDPVSGEIIQWGYENGSEPGDARLAALNTTTDENGEATVEFTGSTDVRDIVVTAVGEGTRTVSVLVHVADLPSGGVEVVFDYNGPVRLGTIEVYVVDDPSYCDVPNFMVPPENVLLSGSVMNPAQTITLEPLLSNVPVSVVARARLETNGTLAGGGCFGDLRIPENTNARVTLPLFLLPLNPAGTYDTINHFDFTDAIPGTIGDVIRQLVRFFGDENHEREIAGVLFDLVEGLVREAAGAIGGFIIDVVRGWIEDDLNDIINNYIDNDGPPWLRSFFVIGSDIVSIVSYMEVISEIQLTKPRSDGTFDGSQNWVGLAFHWDLPCQDDPDPDCGRHAFRMSDIADGIEGVNLVFGQFTGRIHSYNHGEFDPHTLDLQYGRLILFVLNNLVLPAIADGARTLRDALLNLANCPGFANGITGGGDCLRLAGICIADRDTIEGWCSSVVGLAGDAAGAIIGNLRLDTRLTVSGRTIFVEETSDLSVDKLTEGEWEGTIRTQNDEGPPFSGDFEGSRL
jgi:hypothetical protein